ncbi:molybdopterin molybdotransferase MoeA [Candidatus Methylocalor cossyra]|uniref:Molybdopterin molybdenumtransferase n=1 Tax=Candidatus Methylocalor cossyra TaxID=3108543 RepID=A0ABM9NK36_9GAMM
MAAERPDACAEPRLLPLEQARQRILALLAPVEGVEHLPLRRAQGRILAEDVVATLDLPAFAQAAMDGYALKFEDLTGHTTLRRIGTSLAGHPFAGPVGPGECVRIVTGAALPAPTDTVVEQERVRLESEAITLLGPLKPGANVRPPGDSFRAGEVLLSAGRRLGAADLGLLAALGRLEVAVRRPLRVAFFSTGDELRPAWESLPLGTLYESNRPLLEALLRELGAEPLDLGLLPDDPEALERVLREAAPLADAVVSTGGASVGEADLLVRTLRALGRVEFWKVAVKPGKPFAFGWVGPIPVFALPGNPVAVLVTFRQLVRPGLERLAGTTPRHPLRLSAVCENRLDKVPGRLEFQTGIYRCPQPGLLTVSGLPGQGSHRLTSISRANCFIVLPADRAGSEPGARVEIEPFDQPW